MAYKIYKLLKDKSRYISLDKLLISVEVVPKSLFILRSTNVKLGRDENENSWSIHFKPELVRFNLITLLVWLHDKEDRI